MPPRPPVSRLVLLVSGVALSAVAAAPSLAQAPTTAPASDAAAAATSTAATAVDGGKRAPVRAVRKIAPNAPFTGADIEVAAYEGGDLPAGRSPITAKVQVLLDRSGISPGVTDGFKGGMSESAIKAFERKLGLPMDGKLDPEVWAQLQAYAAGPLTQSYTITDADGADLVDHIPTDYAKKAEMKRLGYTSIAERLGERFHMDEKFIAFLNPGVELKPGATITVVTPAKPIKGQVTRIIVDKASGRVAGYNDAGALIVDYPATVGSTDTPSPSGNHKVEGVAMNPEYTYNPKINFKQGDNDKVLTIPPGPNGPVGSVWIDLDKPTYGIHGTATPSRLFVNQSHGCVRLTNWDAEELAHMVKPNVTMVEFLDPGVTIADVTDKVAPPPPAAAATTAATTAGTAPAATAPGHTAPAATGTHSAPAAPNATTLPDTVGPTTLPTTPPAAGAAADPLAEAINNASGGAAPVAPVTPAAPAN